MPNRLQDAADAAIPKLSYGMRSMAASLPGGIRVSDGKGKLNTPHALAAVSDDDPNGILVGNKEDWENPAYTPQLLAHEATHVKVENLPPTLRAQMPPDNPADISNYGGTAGLKKINADPLKLSNEQLAYANQYGQAMGAKADPIYKKLSDNFDALPLSTILPTTPNQKGINTTPRAPGLPSQPVWGMDMHNATQIFNPGDPAPGDDTSAWKPVQDQADTSAWKPVQSQSSPNSQDVVSATPTAQAASPSKHPVQDWLQDLNSDMTTGGTRTLPGRIMGRMQGRGDAGYSGVQAGVSPATGKLLGSLITGPIHTLQGLAETPQHPIKGPLHALQGNLETLQMPGMFMGGPEMEAAAEAIPSASHAASVFNDIENAAKDVPVFMEHTKPALGRFAHFVSNGGQDDEVIQKLAARAENTVPQIDPKYSPNITFPDARKIYGNVSDLTKKPGYLRSLMEDSKIPKMRMAAGDVREALKSDLTDAASQVGRGEDYIKATNEYKNAAQMKRVMKIAGTMAAAEAARKTGILGNFVQKVLK